MDVVDPTSLLKQIDRRRLASLVRSRKDETVFDFRITEPQPEILSETAPNMLQTNGIFEQPSMEAPTAARIIRSKVQRFDENVDT